MAIDQVGLSVVSEAAEVHFHAQTAYVGWQALPVIDVTRRDFGYATFGQDQLDMDSAGKIDYGGAIPSFWPAKGKTTSQVEKYAMDALVAVENIDDADSSDDDMLYGMLAVDKVLKAMESDIASTLINASWTAADHAAGIAWSSTSADPIDDIQTQIEVINDAMKGEGEVDTIVFERTNWGELLRHKQVRDVFQYTGRRLPSKAEIASIFGIAPERILVGRAQNTAGDIWTHGTVILLHAIPAAGTVGAGPTVGNTFMYRGSDAHGGRFTEDPAGPLFAANRTFVDSMAGAAEVYRYRAVAYAKEIVRNVQAGGLITGA